MSPYFTSPYHYLLCVLSSKVTIRLRVRIRKAADTPSKNLQQLCILYAKIYAYSDGGEAGVKFLKKLDNFLGSLRNLVTSIKAFAEYLSSNRCTRTIMGLSYLYAFDSHIQRCCFLYLQRRSPDRKYLRLATSVGLPPEKMDLRRPIWSVNKRSFSTNRYSDKTPPCYRVRRGFSLFERPEKRRHFAEEISIVISFGLIVVLFQALADGF